MKKLSILLMMVFGLGLAFQSCDNSKTYAEMKEEERADKCMSCGACEDACPQKLPIREHLAQVAELMQSL